MASSTSSASSGFSRGAPGSSGTGGGGGEAMAAFAFQSLEGKIETMQQEHNEKLRALEAEKRDAAAMKEDLAAFAQGKQLLQRKAATLTIQHQQAALQLLEAQLQAEAATQAIKDLQRLLALVEPAHAHAVQRPGSKGGDDGSVGSSMLAALGEEITQWEAAALEREVHVRVLRRFNTLLEEEIRKVRQALGEKQEEMSKLVRENLRSEEPARMVAVHEAVVAHKRALQQLRGVNASLLAKVQEKEIRLEALKQKAQAMDASLREEEAAYMSQHPSAASRDSSSSPMSLAPLHPPPPAAVEAPTHQPPPALQQQQQQPPPQEARQSMSTEGDEDEWAGYGLSLACDA